MQPLSLEYFQLSIDDNIRINSGIPFDDNGDDEHIFRLPASEHQANVNLF